MELMTALPKKVGLIALSAASCMDEDRISDLQHSWIDDAPTDPRGMSNLYDRRHCAGATHNEKTTRHRIHDMIHNYNRLSILMARSNLFMAPGAVIMLSNLFLGQVHRNFNSVDFSVVHGFSLDLSAERDGHLVY
ncbi:hypothetical protein Fcan01_27696 [Folsomia candida]|uniref:Uncharacterized protein n=1 Tax=Folsomia candida TaxID=158441 RepID=A0A226CXT2_FOLCA|nr:hypothetical protein Fcan01_27696 [Folsomia candida]